MEDRACFSKGEETLLSFKSLIPARNPSPSLIFLATGLSSSTRHSLFLGGLSQDAPCGSLPARSLRPFPAATGPSQGSVLGASSPVAPLHGVDPCTPLPMTLTAIVKPLADVSLLDEVLRFQKGTLPLSRSSWGEGPSSSSTTPF